MTQSNMKEHSAIFIVYTSSVQLSAGKYYYGHTQIEIELFFFFFFSR
jgi:hypothetical protein